MLIDFEPIIDALADTGWLVLPNFFPADAVSALRQQALSQWQAGSFHAAGIGQGSGLNVNQAIRGDQVQWLEPCTQGALGQWQGFVEQLRLELNRSLYLGLFEYEHHFALYPAGAFYRSHIDNFRGTSARLVTTLLYLNDTWQTQDGGQLRLYTDGTQDGEFRDIEPQGGTVILFLSERFWHEVLPANRQRLSLTGWLRKRT
jgi:SM-20-related protein